MDRKNFCKMIMVSFLMLLLPAVIFGAGSQDVSTDKSVITMMHFMSPAQVDANDKAFAASLEEYRGNNPDIVVEDEFITHDNYEVKLKTMIVSQELPDVYYAKPDLFPLLQENGLIMPIKSVLEEDEEFAALFKDGAFGDFDDGNDIWGFPFQLQSNHVVYYNKDLFKKAGISSFPQTEGEFIAACEKLNKAGITPIVLGNKGKWVAPSCIFNSMVYKYADADWFYSVNNKSGASFSDDVFVKSSEFLMKLVDVGAFNEDVNSLDHLDQRMVYGNGEAAMFIEGSWALSSIIEDALPEVKAATSLGLIPPAKGNERNRNLVAGGAGWAICINPKIDDAKKELILSFVKEVYGQTYGDTAALNGGFPAVIPQVDLSGLDPLMAEYASMPLQFGPIFDVQLKSSIVDVFYNGLPEMMMGNITPVEYAASLDQSNK